MSLNPYVQNTEQATVSDLFNGYIKHLEIKKAHSCDHVRRALTMVGNEIGKDIIASQIKSEMVCDVLSKIYAKGSRSHAAWLRQTLNSVWVWGSKNVNDYRITDSINFGIGSNNPIAEIPCDTKALTASRERFFTEKEMLGYLRFLQANSEHPASGVLLLALLTGSRIEEIANLRVIDFNNDVGTIFFAQTKCGNSHKIGLGQWAWSILREKCIGKSEDAYIFPGIRNHDAPISNNSIYVFFANAGLKNACPRDSRRTFKTLAQAAGIKREILDLIQNHRDGTVASKHYDKFFATSEAIDIMQEVLNRWEHWLLGFQKQKMVA